MNAVLPRLESRPHTQVMHVLLISLALLFAGLASFLQPWISVFAFMLLGWRAWAASRGKRMPGRVVKILFAVFGFAMVLASYRTLNGAEAGSALLMIMIALKLTEVQRIRDAVFVIVLGYFLLFAGFLYSQEIPFVAWMLFAAWGLTAALLIVTRNTRKASFRHGLRESGSYLLQALPFAAIIFVLFPRIPGPLWGVPSADQGSVSGLDDSMSPGSISKLVGSDEIAFRVRFEGDLPPTAERYWRGPALQQFDGRNWTPGFTPVNASARGEASGTPVHYTVMMEPHQRRWLFALTLPVEFPKVATLTPDFQLVTREPVKQRVVYEVSSALHYTLNATLTPVQRKLALQLPDRFNPRSRALAEQWRSQSRDDTEIVQRALAMFRNQAFYYTLDPPLLGGNTVDEFLFDTRRGFCEHYASAFTFLMRAAGIPARVVTGYLGGEMNYFSGFFEVSQSDAHAWSEVWLPEHGWTRVDPTGAVAPSRVEQGVREALAGQDLPSHLSRRTGELLYDLQMQWGAINGLWYEFFLGFGPEMQKDFLEWLGLDDPDWRNMIIALTILMSGFALLLWAWLAWTHRAPPMDPALHLFRRLQRKLEPRVGPPRPTEGPRHFAMRVAERAPSLAIPVGEFVNEYVRLRYQGSTAASYRRLKQLLNAVRT